MGDGTVAIPMTGSATDVYMNHLRAIQYWQVPDLTVFNNEDIRGVWSGNRVYGEAFDADRYRVVSGIWRSSRMHIWCEMRLATPCLSSTSSTEPPSVAIHIFIFGAWCNGRRDWEWLWECKEAVKGERQLWKKLIFALSSRYIISPSWLTRSGR